MNVIVFQRAYSKNVKKKYKRNKDCYSNIATFCVIFGLYVLGG